MAILKKGTNSKGEKFAIEASGKTFYVHKLFANYAAHVHGGLSYSYRYIGKFSSQAEAEALFSKKVGAQA